MNKNDLILSNNKRKIKIRFKISPSVDQLYMRIKQRSLLLYPINNRENIT